MNRTEKFRLGFAVLVWLVLAVILLVSPEIYDDVAGGRPLCRLLIALGPLVRLSVPPALPALAVVRRQLLQARVWGGPAMGGAQG